MHNALQNVTRAMAAYAPNGSYPEGPGYWDTFRSLIITGNIAGARIHDARIAAVCLTHGVTELWTADRDFSRFLPLRTHNPLL